MFKKIKNGDEAAFLTLLIIAAFIFCIPYMILTGNTPQIYNDIVLEWTSRVFANKSAEMFLIYLLSFFGIISYLIYYFIVKYKNKNETENIKKIPISKPVLFLIGAAVFYETLVVFDIKNFVFIFAFLYTLILYFKNKNKIIDGLIFYFINLYTVYAIFRLYAFLGGIHHMEHLLAVAIAFVVSTLLLFIKDSTKIISKIILINQLFLPCLLLLFLTNKYKYNEEFIIINPPFLMQAFIYIIISVLLIEAIYLLKKNWGKENSFNKILSLGALISIAGFNSFLYQGAVVPMDLHHPFENIIGFHQIFQMGQTPFSEYIPISGLYSIIHGAIFQLFSEGLISQINIADNIFFFIFCIFAIVLLKFHVDKKYLFLFAVLYVNLSYDRSVFILPIMLILSLPKLIENKNLWLKVWILTSLFHGLYYPLLGASVCFGFFPLAIYQFITYIKSDDIKKQIKKFSFYFYWALTFFMIIISTPLLIGTYKHIKAMGNQTILADGIARFGQSYGKSFMPYLSDNVFYKLILIYCLTFIIPALFIWVAFALALKIFNFKANEKIKSENITKGLTVFSLVIFPLVAYTYTTVRLDVNTIYARSFPVLFAAVVMLVLYSIKYLKNKYLKYLLISFSLFVMLFSSCYRLITYNEAKLVPYYRIPKRLNYIKNDTEYKIKTGFIDQNTMDAIITSKPQDKDKSKNYFAKGVFAIYYIHNLKGISTLEAGTIKGYKAAIETVDILKNAKDTVVSKSIDPLGCYYLYHYLLTSGDYIWQKDSRQFIYNNGYDLNYVYKNNNKIPLGIKYFIYILYQIVLIYLVSKLLVYINDTIINCFAKCFIVNFSAVLSKIFITPITMILNFFIMKGLVERV